MFKSRRINGVGHVTHVAETENLVERDHSEDVEINGRIILKLIFKKDNEIVDWTELIQDGNMWRVVVNAVMNFCVPLTSGNFLTGTGILSSEDIICLMELIS